MQADDALINLYNEEGKIIGQKVRSQIDKKRVILKGVYILILNKKGEIFVTKPKDSVFQKQWGCSAAGIVRAEETALESAKRTLQRETALKEQPLFLGERFHNFDGVKRFLNAFYVKTDKNPRINEADVQEGMWMKVENIEENEMSPTFLAALKLVKEELKW